VNFTVLVSPVDALLVMDGWQLSAGCRLEVELARELELPVLRAEDLLPLNEGEDSTCERIVQKCSQIAAMFVANGQGLIEVSSPR
jgi:hypothetical protein